ncbi:MAG: hypothetical protein AB1815_02450 [Bacillota bacterium]
MKKTISMYIHPSTEEEISRRGDNRSHVINRDLERLYTLYRRAIREVPLTESEACLIVDALNGSLYDAQSAPMLWASIQDAITLDGLAAKWRVDGAALVEKLRALSAFQSMALVDAAERFWSLPAESRDRDADIRKLFNVMI